MRVWLDDERPMPEGYTHHVKTAAQAIELLKSGEVELISLDYCLDPTHSYEGRGDGLDVAKWIEYNACNDKLKPIHRIKIHTSDPEARENMRLCICNAKRFWMKNK